MATRCPECSMAWPSSPGKTDGSSSSATTNSVRAAPAPASCRRTPANFPTIPAGRGSKPTSAAPPPSSSIRPAARSRRNFFHSSGPTGVAREGPWASAEGPDELELFIESTKSDLLTNGDNICAAPWGDLVICEDFAIKDAGPHTYIRGITPDGKIYSIARNAKDASEFAGSCFSPDGKWLFVNVQSRGTTFGITGPWEKRKV